jgi:hypothetical protein
MMETIAETNYNQLFRTNINCNYLYLDFESFIIFNTLNFLLLNFIEDDIVVTGKY